MTVVILGFFREWLDNWFGRPRNGSDAASAIQRAKRNLEESKSQWPRVESVTRDLERASRENHFAQTIRDVLRGT